jgi:glyoxylase-like metal-dependent hydrolase (beta-lactamase superfamily II)
MSHHQRLLSCKSQSHSVLAVLVLLLLTGVATAQEKPARFEVIKVTDEIYVHRDNGHMNLFLITDEGIVIVDPMNPSAGSNLAQVLQRMAPDKKLLAIVYSHYHSDHAGGARPLLWMFMVTTYPLSPTRRPGNYWQIKTGKVLYPRQS